MPRRKNPEPEAAEVDQWDEEMQKLQWTPKDGVWSVEDGVWDFPFGHREELAGDGLQRALLRNRRRQAWRASE